MSAATIVPAVPAFPAVSAPGKRIAFSAAAAAIGPDCGSIGMDNADKAAADVEKAAIALLRALAHFAPVKGAPDGTGAKVADHVIGLVLRAAADEADKVVADRGVVTSAQVKAAADKAATGDFRARSGRR